MSVALATHNLEPKPRPTPPSRDPIAVLALAFSVATLAMLLTDDADLSVTIGGMVLGALWNGNGGRIK
ncbi:hypothetical protein AB0I35_04910 [Nocardia sp. NPDC050378]|uniref:hypothetical protein n=1 Tax=Nocardia sp. NPDC050378 TaxID=3155400 RepID=UPI0033C51AAD